MASEYYEGMPLTEETKTQASQRYIEVWTKAMDPYQKSEYEVLASHTSFKKEATSTTLESVVKEAIATSDRIWGRLKK